VAYKRWNNDKEKRLLYAAWAERKDKNYFQQMVSGRGQFSFGRDCEQTQHAVLMEETS
jgi:hypothetical protein